jgi:RNA polymerase sigma factor (sigma-70 family)
LAASDPLEPELRKLIQHPYDREAWERLYQILWPWLVSMAQSKMQVDFAVAEDISQEVMLRLLRLGRFHEEFREPKLFRGYVRRICQNLAIDWLRQRVHRQASALLPEEWQDKATPANNNLLPLMMIGQARRRLQADETKLLDLWLDGHSPAEIGDALNLSIKTVYNQLTALRKKIRDVVNVPAPKN